MCPDQVHRLASASLMLQPRYERSDGLITGSVIIKYVCLCGKSVESPLTFVCASYEDWEDFTMACLSAVYLAGSQIFGAEPSQENFSH